MVRTESATFSRFWLIFVFIPGGSPFGAEYFAEYLEGVRNPTSLGWRVAGCVHADRIPRDFVG